MLFLKSLGDFLGDLLHVVWSIWFRNELFDHTEEMESCSYIVFDHSFDWLDLFFVEIEVSTGESVVEQIQSIITDIISFLEILDNFCEIFLIIHAWLTD